MPKYVKIFIKSELLFKIHNSLKRFLQVPMYLTININIYIICMFNWNKIKMHKNPNSRKIRVCVSVHTLEVNIYTIFVNGKGENSLVIENLILTN